ncbi:heavy-metal-associated domain-containing protein [Subsaximicrobium wynnwilliamsii]|uniref:Heavy-metal-associated domain-containing protein n=1 Tax=Subsaximicrobium wynnwilliamsii TaxID=291179 RepID=A0A5C6ZGU7_9FLAO|nr:heavy metal-associated domain-containing protein [Subsaximicrobium wynnwilliamsii]TXD83756.1 heavy-metal-associated domain-containing protein [Subsaximicrobium wynnwilliamsii]TXD89361.1 heavy-metal-associated domain-containing protein [Subsaximicrobium wynnwilliamsii]TXE03592.1 heavy-metal-associated domain-containing protein [Subsaximicrobium wynnwilliamsii]
MKSIKTLLVAVMTCTSILACKNEAQPEVKTVASSTGTETEVIQKLDPNATYAKAEFKIDGMTCAMGCAKTIEKKMAKMDGVKSAKVDFDRKLAMVEYDEAMVTPKTLEETVAKAGESYKVKEMHAVENFSTEEKPNKE